MCDSHYQQNLIALLCQCLLFQFDADCGFQKVKQLKENIAHLERKIRERSMAGARFDLLEEDWKVYCVLGIFVICLCPRRFRKV